MRTLAALLIVSCFCVLSACTLLVEIKDKPDDNTNNVNNANNAQCGNSKREGSEACDGNDLGDTTCADLGLGQGTLSCTASCTFDTSDCASGSCGDGYVSGQEQCDGQNLNGFTCLNFDFQGGTLSCDNVCKFDNSQCSMEPVCGDGLRMEPEICDGEDLGGQSCQGLEFAGGWLSCLDDCQFDTSNCVDYCDNGSIQEWEDCDGDDLRGQSCESFGFSPAGILDCDPSTCYFDFSQCEAMQLTDVRKVVTGYSHSCALTTNGDVYCWGDNTYSQIGRDPTDLNFFPTPVKINGFFAAQDLAAGGWHTCAIADVDGTGTQNGVFCWGNNGRGQTGQDPIGHDTPEPAMVDGISSPMQVVAGREHTCSRLGNGTLVCWGDNGFGQLGDPTGGNFSTTPVTALGLSNVLQVTAGNHTSCAITTSFAPYCWGSNSFGSVGNGNTEYSVTSPTLVFGDFTASYISTSGYHTCAIGNGVYSGVYCWGDNTSGQLGQGTANPSPTLIPTPTVAFGSASATEVEAGGGVSCARAGNEFFCWGYNNYGQLGINVSDTWVAEPTNVYLGAGTTVWSMSHPALFHICVVSMSKSVWCWGSNEFGQLGNANRLDTRVPVQVGD